MQRLQNRARVHRLIDEAIERFELNLEGLRVLTEGASGAYVVTPLIAARAGATLVAAVTRTSPYGSATEVSGYVREWAEDLGVGARIRVVEDAGPCAPAADIVTNLGFVRPIDAALVRALPPHAVVSLMWEPWELREQDLDLAACAAAGVAVVATNERDPRLQVFDYVGMLAAKLVLECDVEIFGSQILVVGSGVFGAAVEKKLTALGAETRRLVRSADGVLDDEAGAFVARADAVVVAEHVDRREMVGVSGGIRPERFAAGCRLVHIAGLIDEAALAGAGVVKHPARAVTPGYMTLATDYVGPRPVIDLHAAGLRVAADAVRCRLAGGSPADAVAAAGRSGLGLPVSLRSVSAPA